MSLLALGLITFIFIDLILVIIILRRRHQFTANQIHYFRQHWKSIIHQVESNPQTAILDADKLLDQILKIKGYQGSLGEKLQKAQALFNDPDNIWQAHKTRNRIAHELNYQINPQTAQKVLNQFRTAFSDLGLNL